MEERRRNPVPRFQRVALVVLVVMYIYGFWKVEQVQDAQTKNRATLSRAFCISQNKQTVALRSLIVNGTKASKPFEKQYRRFGLPPYEERVRQAEQFAATLKVNDCQKLVDEIEDSATG